MPMRFKGFHVYNTGPIFESMMALFKPFMPKKFTERVNTILIMYDVVNTDLYYINLSILYMIE